MVTYSGYCTMPRDKENVSITLSTAERNTRLLLFSLVTMGPLLLSAAFSGLVYGKL